MEAMPDQLSASLAAAPSDAAGRWMIRLDRSLGQELGLEVDPETLEIDGVEVGGLVAAWNESFPSRAARAGDRIVEVNGQSSVAAIIAECQRARVLTVALLRQATLKASLQDSEQRLRDLQAKLRTRMSTTAEPGLKRALLQVEGALGVPGSPTSSVGRIPAVVPHSGRRSDASLCSSIVGGAPVGEDLEELLQRVPTRVQECLRSGFAKLLGEVATVERRFEAQTKTGAELATSLGPAEAVRQRLREVEDRYMQFCALHDGGTQGKSLKRINEATARTHGFQLRLDETMREVQALKRERQQADEAWEAQKSKLAQGSKGRVKVTSLANEIQEKSKLKAKLERELPGYLSVIEEHKLMLARIAELKMRPATARRAVSPARQTIFS